MSYSGDPSTSKRDAVRFELGDTDTTREQVRDEEIDYILGLTGNHVLRTCAHLAEALAAKYARKDTVGGAGQITYTKSQLYDHYKDLAARFTQRIGSGVMSLQTSKAAIDLLTEDSDLPDPQFKRGMHDNEGTSTTDDPTL